MLGISRGTYRIYTVESYTAEKSTILCSIQHSGGTGVAVQQREGGGGVRPLPPLLAPHRSAGGGASQGPHEISPIGPREIKFRIFITGTNFQ